MAEFLNFGSGIDGDLNISSPTTWTSPTALATGTAGNSTVTSSSILALNNGDYIFLHQLQGSIADPEIHQVISGAGTTTLTLDTPLINSYNSTGTNKAIILRVSQYGNGTLTSSLSASAWNGATGGYIVACFNGLLKVDTGGSITVTGKGFRGGGGGFGATEICDTGDTGESYTATGTVINGSTTFGASPSPIGTANASAGVGGQGKRGSDSSSGGGGGSNTTAGTAGAPTVVGGTADVSGGATGSTTATISFGGGGGGGGKSKDPNGLGGGDGGQGGGIIYIFARNVDCANGGIFANGADGLNGQVPGAQTAGGGGGGGGIIKVWTTQGILGTNRLLALGGAGGLGTDDAGDGGNGGNGKIVVNSCEFTGTTNPTVTATTGGFDFCSSVAFIM